MKTSDQGCNGVRALYIIYLQRLDEMLIALSLNSEAIIWRGLTLCVALVTQAASQARGVRQAEDRRRAEGLLHHQSD